jgi:hypothetical protein
MKDSSENKLERIGRIRTLKTLEKGNQVVVYYNITTLNIEVHVEKFDNSMTEKTELVLSVNETKQLINLLEKSTYI